MTADDLRVQKGLAMLEHEEALKAKGNAWTQYHELADSLIRAAETMKKCRDADQLRAELSRYAHIVNVDAAATALDVAQKAVNALAEAERKLAVFRS
jgi:hypothetical protein